jgi:hypothetical protein
MIPPAALRPTAAVELLHLDEEVRAAALLLGGLAGAVVAAMRCAHQAPWAASELGSAKGVVEASTVGEVMHEGVEKGSLGRAVHTFSLSRLLLRAM